MFVLLSPVLLAADKRPNLLFVLADDVGQEVLGCYGGTSYKTPHLDALAAGGLRFDHGYSMPVCHPTRLTLMTGKYPFRIGAGWGKFPKDQEATTFSSLLQENGYATAVAGKWQMTLLKKDPQHPARCGFDQWSLFGWHEGARYYDPYLWENGKLRNDLQGQYGPDRYTDFLIHFMKHSRDAGKPFLAYYSMALAHDVTDDLPNPVPYMPGKDRWQDYKEMAETMDTMLGKLIAALDELGLRKNTLILFTGDNGTASRSIIRHDGRRYVRDPVSSLRDGRRIPGGKGSLKDTGTRVPLIANWPGTIEPGGTSDQLVDCSDFLPTFCKLTGTALPKNTKLDGRSFAGSLTGGEDPHPRTWAYAERGGKYFVRNQHWKLYNDGTLHDLRKDTSENNGLRANAEHSPEAKAARKLLDAAQIQLGRGAKY